MIIDQLHLPSKFHEVNPLPKTIYYDGDLALLDNYTVTIVGSREPTSYGISMTHFIVEKLIKHGIVVVSGFARGIDYEAHKRALACGGKTIAVLGCGLDINYPKHKSELLEDPKRILRLTEYPAKTSPRPEHFPRRNRLLSALGDVVIVIECVRKSGTMITAHHAIEQGKDLFCLPGDIRNRYAEGPNYLISLGAFPITSIEELERELIRRRDE